MSTKLKAGVVGAGVFGGHHARQYAALSDVELVGVFDPDAAKAAKLADELGVRTFADLDGLIGAVDALTVASPAAGHLQAGEAALRAGRHVYVEKPLAARLDEAERLVALAQANDRILACGHQERVVFQAMGLLDIPETPLRLEAIRRQPGPSRIVDVSCVLDLMIHDIDLALTLVAGETRVVSVKGQIGPGGLVEEARAQIAAVSGAELVFEASRIAEARERRMRIVYPSGEVEIDFINRTFANTTPHALDAEFAATPAGANPLRASVAAFVDAALGRAARPAVSGQEALRALVLALAVESAAKTSAA